MTHIKISCHCWGSGTPHGSPFFLFCIFSFLYLVSVDKGKHGFGGQKCAHTSSKSLTIRQYSLRPFHRLATFLLRQNCFAPDRDGFSSDFCFLRRGCVVTHQGEKGKKRRKDALSGVSALVNRYYSITFSPRISSYSGVTGAVRRSAPRSGRFRRCAAP